jgi:hypothetical protein
MRGASVRLGAQEVPRQVVKNRNRIGNAGSYMLVDVGKNTLVAGSDFWIADLDELEEMLRKAEKKAAR